MFLELQHLGSSLTLLTIWCNRIYSNVLPIIVGKFYTDLHRKWRNSHRVDLTCRKFILTGGLASIRRFSCFVLFMLCSNDSQSVRLASVVHVFYRGMLTYRIVMLRGWRSRDIFMEQAQRSPN